MSQYNENDPNRPLDSTPDAPLTGGPTPPPPGEHPGMDPLSAEPSAEPATQPGANPPPPPLFSQESQASGASATPGLDPGPAGPGATPPPPPTGNATPGYGANNYGANNYGAAPSQTAGTLTAPTPEERNWAMFAHLSGLIIGILGAFTTLPAWGFIGPLVIWLVKKDQSPYIADQAKEALNFCITFGIAMFVLWLMALVLFWTIIVPFLVMIAMALLGIGALVLMIMASVKASEGQLYRYPFTIRLIN